MTSTVVLAAESENPLLPATYDIVWSAICVAIIGFFFWKYALPRFSSVLAERTDKIEGGIARAEAAQAEAQEALEQYRRQLDEARQVAAKIREEARAQGQQIIAEMREQAQLESDRIVAHGQQQLAAQRQQVVAELRQDLGRTAVDLAERIIGDSLADDVSRAGTVDRFLDELDSVAAQGK